MESTITPFLLKKWQQSFRFLDVNKDGVISPDDFAEIADYISRKTNATADEAAKTQQEWTKWHDILVGFKPSKTLDLEQSIKGNTELFKDVDHHIKLNRSLASSLFDRLDFNKDGLIELDELVIFYEAVGITDKALVKAAFDKLDKDGDSFICRDEFIEDVVRHYTNPDPEDGRAYFISSVMD